MTPPPSDFRAALSRLGLSQRAFARVLADLAGREPQYRTIERWGVDRDPPDAAWALVALMERAPGGWREPIPRPSA
jgi:hypothetical protein